MKKTKVSFFFMLFLTCLMGQGVANDHEKNSKQNFFNITISQGFAYGMQSNNRPFDDEMAILLSTPKLGTLFDVDITIRLTDIRYLSLSYSNQYNGKKLTESYYYPYLQTWLHFNDFYFYQRRQFLSLRYITKLTTHVEFGAGFSYMFSKIPRILIRPSINPTGDIVSYNIFLAGRHRLRSDNALSITAMAGWFFPINDYVELSVKTGCHLGILGFQSVYITPGLRITF